MIGIICIGIAVGCVYALVAAGYSLTYRTTGIVNFAQGAYVMIGGMTTSWALTDRHLPYLVAILIGFALTVAIGGAMWLIVILPLWRVQAAPFVVLLATIVVATLVGNAFQPWLGSDPRTLPPWIDSLSLTIDGVKVEGQYLIIVVCSVVLLAVLTAVVRYTRLGRSMRAVAASRETSALLGISPERTGAISVLLGAGIGGLAGILITPAQFTSVDSGLTYGVLGFVAAVVGGFGNLAGALVGGVALGVIQAVVGRYISVDYTTVIAFGLLLALLAVRPQGLIGVKWSDE